MKKKKVLVIVAHPDDEIIWMGGMIIRNSVFNDRWDTTIISLCRRDDSDRAPKFFRVCKILNAKGFISDLNDDDLNDTNEGEVINKINEFLNENGNEYDYVFTHGENAEYGHKRHKDVNKAVRKMIKDKSIKSKKVFFFAYEKIDSKNTDTGFDCYIDKSADKFINLNKIEILKKKEIIEMIYGYQKGGFEERNCRESEAFKIT